MTPFCSAPAQNDLVQLWHAVQGLLNNCCVEKVFGMHLDSFDRLYLVLFALFVLAVRVDSMSDFRGQAPAASSSARASPQLATKGATSSACGEACALTSLSGGGASMARRPRV